MSSAAERVSSTGSVFASSLFSYAQAVGERVKSLLPVGAAEVETIESEQEKANRLAAAATAEAGAEMIRQAAEKRMKAAKELEEKEAVDVAKNPQLKSIPALKPQANPKELPSEVQKRPNDPSLRQPCRVYPWLSLWKVCCSRVSISHSGCSIGSVSLIPLQYQST